LKCEIKDIRAEGLKLRRELGQAYMDRLLQEAGVEQAPGQAGLHLDVELVRSEETVFVRGEISGAFSVTCARCLEPARVQVEERSLKLTFLPPITTTEVSPEEELEYHDLDTFTHDGKQIDLAPLVREQVLLAIPITPLCRPDCLGICESCGVNRNLATCDCEDQEQPSTPWTEALGQLKKNMQGG
jgi:uncharacterized protein